jgi:integrase/recombinase XerD
MRSIDWAKYPQIHVHPLARAWLQMVADLGRSPHTVDAYGRGLNAFLAFVATGIEDPLSGSVEHPLPEAVTRAHIVQFVHHLLSLPGPHRRSVLHLDSGAGLATATLQQRLTAVRLWFDYLVEEGSRSTNPVGRGKYVRGGAWGAERGLLRRTSRLPWIPTEEEWLRLLLAARVEPLRNRVMLALQYEGALRREELVSLAVSDIDPAFRTVSIRAEMTKGKARSRIVTYSPLTGRLYQAYLLERRRMDARSGPLFLSRSNRNRAQAVSVSTWDKVVRGVRERAGVPRFTTHTPRHLCLTDLARAGWGLRELAEYAGHRDPQTTMTYIHLSGRDLVHKFAKSMQRQEARLATLTEALS